MNGASPTWKQFFTYDQYGNRNFNTNTDIPTPLTNLVVSQATNRLDHTADGQSWVDYDYAGNLVRDAQGLTYEYDAENRLIRHGGNQLQITSDSSNKTGDPLSTSVPFPPGVTLYYYDGDGHRVRKITSNDANPTVTTTFIYNVANQLVAEYTDSPPSPGGTSYLTSDHLGTARVITGTDGTVKARHDYLPFGEEIPAGYGNRNAPQGYVLDKVRQKFTQKERDIETGLDYFLARYYSSTQGRFTSPDEFTGGPDELFDFAETASANPTFYADLGNPQSLNKYQYTFNNPLRYTDPDGHCPAGTPCPVLPMIATDVATGAGKAIANIGIGMNNVSAHFGVGGAEYIEPKRANNLAQAVGLIVTEKVTFFGSLVGGRAQVGGVLVADTKTTAVAASEAANAAQQLPRASRPATAGALQTAEGQMFTRSTRGGAPLNPIVQEAQRRGPVDKFNGKCCEKGLISDVLNAGQNPRGGTIAVVNVRRPGHPNHGTPKQACPSCRAVLDFMGIKH